MAVTELGRKATVACPFCATLNRVDLGRLPDRPKCGHCGRPILVDRPVAVTDATEEAVLAGDRKSTRLNSSHLVISYAVFCLKKKKQQVVRENAAAGWDLRGHAAR